MCADPASNVDSTRQAGHEEQCRHPRSRPSTDQSQCWDRAARKRHAISLSRALRQRAILTRAMPSYDPTFPSTVAVVVPVIFVLIGVDLGLIDRQWGPRMAGVLLMVIVLLLAAEALCLYSIHDRRPLSKGDEAVVALALLMSGGLVFLRVAAPLIVSLSKHRLGWWVIRLYPLAVVVLLVLNTVKVISLGTAITIVAFSSFVLAWILPSMADDFRSIRRHWRELKQPNGSRPDEAAGIERPEHAAPPAGQTNTTPPQARGEADERS